MPISLGIAEQISGNILTKLKPLCAHCAVAGTVRLKLEEPVSCLQLVVRPVGRHLAVLDRLTITLGKPIRDESSYGKLVLDSHLVFPDLPRIKIHWSLPGQFGGLLFLHTGPVGFVQRMEQFWRDHGGDRFFDGYLFKNGEQLDSETEEDLFRHLGVPPVPPEKRILPRP